MVKKLSIKRIEKLLDTEFIGKNIVYYDTTDSTNLQAKLNQNMASGTVFIAEHQTNGRGRSARLWESEKGVGIYMTILLKPDILPEHISSITLLLGLCACISIEEVSLKKPFIKWPNDIVIEGKKVCGILCELTGKKSDCIVLGIGINVNNKALDDAISDTATSLFLENNTEFEREIILADILSRFEKMYNKFIDSGFSSFISEYENRCITLNREVEIISPQESYRAEAIAIDKTGALIIEHDGKKKAVTSGEVSVRGIYGYI